MSVPGFCLRLLAPSLVAALLAGAAPLRAQSAPADASHERSAPASLRLGQDPAVFAVEQTPSGPRVSANGRLPVRDAMRQLTAALGWTLRFEPQILSNDLAKEFVDLAFDDQDPEMVARLLAASSGVDVELNHPRDDSGTLHTYLFVLPVPDARSETGRERLRRKAVRWYRSFLQDSLETDPLRESEGDNVRMVLARLLKDAGEVQNASEHFSLLAESAGTPELRRVSRLRLAECLFELQRFDEALQTLDPLTRLAPLSSVAGPAVLLLGDLLMAKGDYEGCAKRLSARRVTLAQTPYYVDLMLLIATAEMYLRDPRQVYLHMTALAGLEVETPPQEFNRSQTLDYHFLGGYGSLGVKLYREAMLHLELFLIQGADDPRRGVAYVMLGEAYLAEGMFLQARAAAKEATKSFYSELDVHWRREADKLLARTSLALGDKEDAFSGLESIVRRRNDALLTLFLVDQLVEDRQFQRAISNARRLVSLTGAEGDQARFKIVEALYLQSSTTGVWTGFHDQARPVLRRIQDKDLQAKAVTLIAEGYAALKRYEEAAEAIRGSVR